MVPPSRCRRGGRLGVPGRSHTPDRKCRPSPRSWAAFLSGFTWASSPSHMPRFSLSPSPTSRLSVPSLESGPGTPCAHRGASAGKGLSLPLPCRGGLGWQFCQKEALLCLRSPASFQAVSGVGGPAGRCSVPSPALGLLRTRAAGCCPRLHVRPRSVPVPSCCSPAPARPSPRTAPVPWALRWVFLVHCGPVSAYAVPGVCEARRRLWWVNNGTFRGSGACCRDSRKVAPIKAKPR